MTKRQQASKRPASQVPAFKVPAKAMVKKMAAAFKHNPKTLAAGAVAGVLAMSPFQMAHADEINVAASIRPIHSVVQMVLGDVGEATLMMSGTSSPHGGSMRPSERRLLQNADLVFMIDPRFENAYQKALPPAERLVVLSEADGIDIIDKRLATNFAEHAGHDDHDDQDDHAHAGHDDHDEHDDHAHAGHDDHDEHDDHAHAGHDDHDEHDDHAHAGHDDHDDHGDHDEHAGHDDHDEHDDHAHAGHDDHDEHDDHAHAGHDDHDEHDDHGDHDGHHHHDELVDLHLWLDPHNMSAMLPLIRDRLSARYPEHADTFAANAAASAKTLDALDRELHDLFAPVAKRGYITHHDAYVYMEKAYGLTSKAAIFNHHDEAANISRLQALREIVANGEVICIFHEPQYNRNVLNVIDPDGVLKEAQLDPLSADIPAGADFYATMMRRLAMSLAGCLSS